MYNHDLPAPYSIVPRGTTQVHRWPVTAAIWSKSLS